MIGKGAGACLLALLAAVTLPGLLRPPGPPPLDPDVGLPRVMATASEPAPRPAPEADIGRARAVAVTREQPTPEIGPSRERTGPPAVEPAPVPPPPAAPPAPPPAAPAIAPAPSPAPTAPGDGSEEFAPH
ncbi:MAG TPA: hypothetical protein VIT85_03660 [Solirubrobacterales bacterium]